MKALQVKAELNKLGEAPRAYNDKLQMESMNIDSGNGNGLTLNERFQKI